MSDAGMAGAAGGLAMANPWVAGITAVAGMIGSASSSSGDIVSGSRTYQLGDQTIIPSKLWAPVILIGGAAVIVALVS